MSIPNSRDSLKECCLDNKYTFWYFNIIDKALSRNWNKDNIIYTEKHHILPKSIIQNNDVVCLTAKEHFICHLLLTKMLKQEQHKRKMVLALHRLVHGNKKDVYIVSSKYYEIIKKWHSEAASIRTKEYWHNISTEQRTAMRSGVKNGRYGKTVNQSTRSKISIANRGRLVGEKHPLWKIGHTEETKRKVSLSKTGKGIGKKWFNNGIKETFDYPQNKPATFTFGRLKRKNEHTCI